MQKEKLQKIIELINWGDSYFKEKGIPESRLNIELMLCHILKCKRMNLYLNFDKPLIQTELEILRDFIKRRLNREPLQYILGITEFMGLPFELNSSVLIPRQETEILVETVIKYSTKLLCDPVKILDIGTGSGNIAISLAKYIKNGSVTAIDIDEKALGLANHNAVLNGVADKINFSQLDILNTRLSDEQYDIIVSNPPYISYDDYKELEPELKFEPDRALTDFKNGLTFYEHILKIAKGITYPHSLIAFEISYNQKEDVAACFELNGYKNISIIKDYSNIDRVITGVPS